MSSMNQIEWIQQAIWVYLIIFVQSLVHIQFTKFWNIYMFVIDNSKSFIPQILKVMSPLVEKLIYFSPLGFLIEKNYASEISEFKLHSFRAFNDI